MDFGVAHVDSSVMTTAGEILGSPSYMSPEQIAGFEVTGAADVYALGRRRLRDADGPAAVPRRR